MKIRAATLHKLVHDFYFFFFPFQEIGGRGNTHDAGEGKEKKKKTDSSEQTAEEMNHNQDTWLSW